MRSRESAECLVHITLPRFELSYLALGDLGFDGWPSLTLRRVTEQVHDDGNL